MSLIVIVVGLLVTGVALALLVSPRALRQLLHRLLEPRWLPLVSALRVAVGVLFILAAPDTRLPTLIRVIGIAAIVGGILILFLGSARSQLLADWWLKRSDTILRLWAGAALIFGALLVWTGS
jgi:uncharacterized membrane protein HdeD (DUF308 family)